MWCVIIKMLTHVIETSTKQMSPHLITTTSSRNKWTPGTKNTKEKPIHS